MPEAAPPQRAVSFIEAELGFPEDLARAESRRCLSCRGCLGCGLCQVVCKPKAIDFDQCDQEVEIEADEIILTPGACQVASPVDEKYGYGRFPDVLMGPEFDRVLSGNGPFGGEVLRPSNGDIPQGIAFIVVDVGVAPGGAAAESMLASLDYTTALASRALSKVPDLQAVIIAPYPGHVNETAGTRPHAGVVFVSGEFAEVCGTDDGRLLLRLTGDSLQSNKFDIIVLCTASMLSSQIARWSQELGLGLEDRLFWPDGTFQARETKVPGVSVAGMIGS